MAVVLDQKVLDIASRIVAAANALVKASHDARSIGDVVRSSGIDLTQYDEVLGGSSLKFVTGQILVDMLTAANAIYEYGEQNGYNNDIAKACSG